MHRFGFLTLLAIAIAAIAPNVRSKDAPRVPKDRFRIVSTLEEAKVKDEMEDFINYGCEKMVIIRNKAQEDFRISCKSDHDSPKQTSVKPGSAYIFTFRPQKNGNTKFWCTVEYRQSFTRFDVYNEALPYMCPRDHENVYQYTVTHQGVYVDPAKGNEGQKIRALFAGHNKFIFWEEFNTANNETDGFLYTGLVDGGMCSDLPEQFNDKPAAVTVCYNHCVHLYQHYGCQGAFQLVQSSDNCVDFGIASELAGQVSSVKGC